MKSNDIENAIESHDLPLLREIIFSIDLETLNTPLDNGWNVLGFAAYYFPEAVPLLVQAGADVISRGGHYLSILCDVPHQDRTQTNAILAAVDALLRAGADPNWADSRGNTPLHDAAYGSPASTSLSVPIVSQLLHYGADPNRFGEFGCNALGMAYLSCNSSVVKILYKAMEESTTNAKPHMNLPELHLAILLEDEATINKLLQSPSADIEMRDAPGRTPLDIAALSGLDNIAEILLDRGANVHSRTSIRDWDGRLHADQGDTPLHFAAFHGHLKTVHLLLDRGANLEELGAQPQEYTPLILATLGAGQQSTRSTEAEETIRYLIQRGADVRRRLAPIYEYPPEEDEEEQMEQEEEMHLSPTPRTALMAAAWIGSPEMVKLLLSLGAAKTPEDLAEAIRVTNISRAEEILPILKKYRFGTPE